MIKVGFVGAGAIAGLHAKGLKKLRGVEIAAWCSRSVESARQMAATYGGEALSFEQMLAREDIRGLLVCTPTPLHARQVLAALQAGKKVFCEKPLARTLQEAEAIRKRGEDRVYVGHVLRFFHEYRRAHELIQRGTLGTISRVYCQRLNTFPRGSRDWFADPKQSGGVLLDLLIHDFDWLLWTFGAPASLQVEGKEGGGWHHVVVHLHWKTGMVATVEGSWLHDQFEHTFRVEGESGSVDFSMQDGVLKLSLQNSEKITSLRNLPDPYDVQMAHFVGWLQGQTEPVVRLEEAVAALRLSLAAIEQLQDSP